jgi:hypothetical protein
MALKTLDDPVLIQKAVEMKKLGFFVSDIARKLSEDTGEKITQMSLWRLFKSKEKELKTKTPLDNYEYPSFEDISYLFNKMIQKDKNLTTIKYKEITIRRNLMLRFLNKYYNKEFTLSEVKYKCNDRNEDENFLRHWEYLLNNNYIEGTTNKKFKFCDRVKKWKNFGSS